MTSGRTVAMRSSLTALTFVFFAILAMGTDEATVSSANCKVESVAKAAEIFVTDQGPDAGYNVRVTVSNQGKQGQVKVTARLSTSDGEWTKERHALMEPGATETLTFGFPEPSVNAQDVRAYGGCTPSR